MGVALIASPSCGRVGFERDDVSDADVNDAGPPDAGSAADAGPCVWGPWSALTEVAELAMPGTSEYDVTLASDGLTMYFTRDDSITRGFLVARRASLAGPWSVAGPPLGLEASGSNMCNGALAPNDLEFFFGCSGVNQMTRPTIGSPWEAGVFVVGDGGGYTAPRGLDVVGGGLIGFLGAQVGGREVVVSISRANLASPFGALTAIPSLDAGFDAGFPTVRLDGLELIVAEREADDQRLVRYVRPDAGAAWGDRLVLDELAGQPTATDPELSPDGRELYAAVSDGTQFDTYVATRACL